MKQPSASPELGTPGRLAAESLALSGSGDLLLEIRERLVEKLWWGLFLIAILGVPLSLSRNVNTGWLPMYSAHLVIGGVVVAAFFLRSVLPYRLKVGLIVTLFWCVGVVGALSLGLMGAGIWWLSVSTLLVCVLVSLRWGVASVLAVITVVVIIGAGFVSGRLGLSFDANTYMRNPTSWAVLLIGTTLMPVIVFYTISQFLNATQMLLQRVHSQALEISEQQRVLTQVNEALRDFSSIVGHDLVEPIRGINTMAVVLLEDHAEQLDAEGHSHLQLIQKNSANLSSMVQDLLKVSRLEHGGINKEPLDTNEVVESVLSSLAELIREKGTEIRIQGPLPPAMGDRVRLREVFYNLIVNAMKYNDKDQPWVEIGAEQHGDQQVFFVADNGIGIQEGHEETIFKMFTRDHTPGKFGAGTGVGLSLVRKIIELHGGQITVGRSSAGGAKFSFSLPVESASAIG